MFAPQHWQSSLQLVPASRQHCDTERSPVGQTVVPPVALAFSGGTSAHATDCPSRRQQRSAVGQCALRAAQAVQTPSTQSTLPGPDPLMLLQQSQKSEHGAPPPRQHRGAPVPVQWNDTLPHVVSPDVMAQQVSPSPQAPCRGTQAGITRQKPSVVSSGS
jgi:hypothetical protein